MTSHEFVMFALQISSGIPGTSMISKVKGKTEISRHPSRNSFGGFVCCPSSKPIFLNLFLWSAKPIRRPDIHLPSLGRLPHHGRLSLGQPASLETLPRACRAVAHAVPNMARPGGKIFIPANLYFLQLPFYAACFFAGSVKSVCFLSTASM